ncbi:MAG: MATE family efflux transporter [Pseudomonadota bacterium]
MRPGVRVADKAPNPRDFTEGEVHGHLVRLTGFMLMGFVSVMGANLMETVYLGRVGTNELAGLGFTFPLVMMLQGITMGLSIGASSVVARSIGLGDWDRARRLITHCFLLVILIISLVAVLVFLLLGPFFSLLGANDEILPLSVHYMQIWLVGLPFFTIAMVGSTLMRATGDAVTPGYLMTIGSGLQILIGPVFIFGLLGMEQMGLAGAAVAFVLARFVSFLMYAWFVFKDRLLAPSLTGFGTSCRDILHVGLPAMASNLISPVSMTIITRLLAGHGAVVVAGFSVASRIEAMVVMIIFALSMSVAPFIGQNWGAGLFDRVRLALRLGNLFAIGWGAFAYLVLFFAGRFLVSLINDDPAVVEAAGWYLVVAPLGIGFMGIMANCTSTFNALGKPMPPLVLSILQMLVIGVPAALLGDYLFGYIGIFAGTVITVSLLGTLSWFWLNREIETGIQRRQAQVV